MIPGRLIIRNLNTPIALILGVSGLFLSLRSLAQTPNNQDCLGAIPVCDWVFNSTQIPPGAGAIPNEINSSISCLGQGEMNSVWYTFTTQSAGNVNFTIFPESPTTDLDWAVFNLTAAGCGDIFTDPSLLVACNFSPFQGPTGANGGPIPQNTPVIPVQQNETYALIITAFTPQQGTGYTLDFSASTSQIFDNTPPSLLEVIQPIRCNTDTLWIRFTENVRCSDLSPASFSLTGPGGTHSVTAIYSQDCASGGSFANQFRLTVSPPLTSNGQYTLNLNGPVNDLCGNSSGTSSPDLVFDYAGLIIDSTFSTLADCNQNNGSAGIAITGGILPLNFLWIPGNQTTPVATNLFAGNYSVTVTDQNNCSVSETVTVSNPVNFEVTFFQIPDTCLKGNGSVTVNATGTSGPFSYQWNQAGVTPGQQTLAPVRGGDVYSATVTDVDGCIITASVSVANIQNDSLQASFTITPNPVDILFPATKLINTSENFTTYSWNVLGQTIQNVQNPVIDLPDWGNYPAILYVFDENGCADTSEQLILVRGDLYYYIPNTFTPDENNLNDRWYPRGVGFETSSFRMTIFDRWSEIIYSGGETDFGWDGRDRNGQPCQAGVYVYKITMEGYEGRLPIFIGKVQLIR